MQAEHRVNITTRCPVNGGVDYYDATFQTEKVVKVEDIDAAISRAMAKGPTFQEDLTVFLATQTKCKVTLIGRHGRFLTTTTEDNRAVS